MILKAKHNIVLYNFFKAYARWKISRTFSSVHVEGDIRKSQLPVLLLSNHTSWWDGFWAMYLNMKAFRRKFHFMMLEEQLRKYWFFNYTGGFSVKKKSKSVLETLNYTTELLADSKNLVLIFPHGEIHSMHQQNFHFEKGIERVLKHLTGKVQIVLLAFMIDYHSNSKPAVYMYVDDFPDNDYNISNLETRYNEFYSKCVEKQIQLIAKM